ncbi:beta-1 adrenergic receptor-like [Amphiura filiformis]|uniref:beta-1 adrenergic receptor-like n=1 Tax=Amphiura filiformis TaxID=82378 RepID=UPI003B21A547
MFPVHRNDSCRSIMTSLNETVKVNRVIPILTLTKSMLLALIFTANIIGNTLCLLVIRRVREMSSVTRLFMTSMTLSDLCTGFFLCIPSFGASIVNRWPFGDIYCSINAISVVCFTVTTAISLLNVTIERFIAVTRPFQYHSLVTVRRARIVTIFVWMAAVGLSCMMSLLPGRTSTYSPYLHSCLGGPEDDEAMDIKGTIIIIVFIITPFSLTGGMFVRVYLLARKHAAQINAQTIAPYTKTRRSDKKAFETFFIMTICLTVFYSPLVAVFVYENLTRSDLPTPFVYLAEVMALSNSVWNFVIYYARNTAFKNTTKRLLGIIFNVNLQTQDLANISSVSNASALTL